MARLNRTAYTSGDNIQIQLTLSNLEQEHLPIRGVAWQIGEKSGFIDVANVTLGLNDLGQVSVSQTVLKAHNFDLELYIHLTDGTRILSNTYSIPVYPECQPSRLNLFIADDNLQATFGNLDYDLVSNQEDADVVLVSKMSDDIKNFVASGGRVLLVANDQNALPQYESGYVIYQDVPFARLMERQSTIWNGDWVSSFSWLSPSLQRLPSPLVDNQFAEIMPDYVLTGFTQSDSIRTFASRHFQEQ